MNFFDFCEILISWLVAYVKKNKKAKERIQQKPPKEKRIQKKKNPKNIDLKAITIAVAAATAANEM